MIVTMYIHISANVEIHLNQKKKSTKTGYNQFTVQVMTNVPTLPDPPETLMGALIGADGGILTTAEITGKIYTLRKHAHAIYTVQKCFGCKNENFH